VLKLLVDTCVWIDLAKDHHQHPFLRALDALIREGKVSVMLPPLVVEEFERNKAKILDTNRASLSSALKRAKELLDQHGEVSGKVGALEQLNYVDQRLPRLGDLTGITAFVEQLLRRAETIPVTDAAKLRAIDRGLAKKAPFGKNNSTADAILIEAFADVVKGRGTTGHQFGFVTHNKDDFSQPKGDHRQHHPDFDGIFTRRKVRYFATLKDALMTVDSSVVDDLEFEEYTDQPRSTDEIVTLIDELLDKVWYNRHKVYEEKVEAGKIKIRPSKGKYDPHGIDPEIWKGALASAKRVEAKYGIENCGPWSDFEWGMMSGKLSALRWALGEDWETTLDT
jgi:PIN domain